jgi:hypothetical protein
MSFDAPNISPVHSTPPATSAQPPRAAAPAAAAQPASESVTVDTMPSTPPPEVLDAIGAAAKAYDRLTANGVQLHFHVDDETGKVAVHVYDTKGSVLGSLAPSEVLDLATSGAFE